MFGSFRSSASNRLCSEYVHVKAQNLEKILAFKTFGLFTCVYTYIYIFICASGVGRHGFALIISNHHVILAQVP